MTNLWLLWVLKCAAFCHNKLWWPRAANSFFLTSKVFWPLVTTNCGSWSHKWLPCNFNMSCYELIPKCSPKLLHWLRIEITRLCCHILPVTFAMLWPLDTINYGGHGPQISSVWHHKCCGHWPQLTMATEGHKWPLCDLNLAKILPIWRRSIVRN